MPEEPKFKIGEAVKITDPRARWMDYPDPRPYMRKENRFEVLEIIQASRIAYILQHRTGRIVKVTERGLAHCEQPGKIKYVVGWNTVCPICKAPAYQGLNNLECSRGCK